MKKVSKNLEETAEIAKDIIKMINAGHGDNAGLIGLYGDLGAGKTTLTQALGRELGVAGPIISPTFVIMKSYPLRASRFKQLIHIDAYRLEKGDELIKLGWADLLADPENLILIEWPERVADIMPEGHTKILLDHISETSRGIEIIR